MIKEEDLIIDIRSHHEGHICGYYSVVITHKPTGESVDYSGSTVHEARQNALTGIAAKVEQSINWARPLWRDFPEIITHADEKGELCYRTHYTDPERNAAHKVFMNDNGWVNDGECMFNSGNGHLYIYRKNK